MQAQDLIKQIERIPSEKLALIIAGISFLWFFVLSFHFPWMFADDMVDITEAARGFSFPQGFISIPRFFFLYFYKLIFYFFGFNAFYFHLFRALAGGVLIYFYYKLVVSLTNKQGGLIASIVLLLSSPFIFTTIWISEPILIALMFQTIVIYLLLTSPTSVKKYVLLIMLLIAALFSKETNLILLPLLVYPFLFNERGKKKLLSLMPIFLFLLYLLIIPTRPVHLNLFNPVYFIIIFSKYYTPVIVGLIVLYISLQIFNSIKTRTIFNFSSVHFIIVWFLLAMIFFVFGHNQEERYIVEILPVFILLIIMSLQWLVSTVFYKQYKKMVQGVLLFIIFYFLIINSYGIIKTEFGWGNVFKAFEEISQTVDQKYPGSLLTYQSGTYDFFSDFRNFTVMIVEHPFNFSLLYQNVSQYPYIFYVQYPERIRAFNNNYLDLFNKTFVVKKGIYEFEVYALMKPSSLT